MNFLETLAPHYKCLDQWKQKAWEALHSRGFPTRKWEAFQYVPLKALYEESFAPLELDAPKIEKKERCCVFVNGVFRADLSHVEGLISLPLSEAVSSYGMFLHKSWALMLKDETNPFYLLNHALYEEGLFLYLPPGEQATVEWRFLTTREGQIHTPKIELYLGRGAELTIKSEIRGEGKYWHNESVNLSLDEGAKLHIEEKFFHSKEAWAFHSKRARLKRDAKFSCTTLSVGARVERHDIAALLTGENCEVDLRGLTLLTEKAEIHQHLLVRHEAPHTRSNQHYKTVLQGRSRSSFEGKIYVEKEAQKTEAYQLNNNLLLSPKAQAMSKPNLEIMADDVRASHGATITQPKADELFYLRARGLDEEEAKRILVKGFCRELIDDEAIDGLL
ncbi:MAG: FeS cluster assembly protein SufD [Chlamydiae bacterium]|nr:FeS cluster assembly protein SufD [Chlamydiota bacterium]